ncbi:hypothetical protein ATANTOWER_014758 [Ataeniobius toweri]|uniref:Uncharacterized protein n=1 Tax=Ataeniobius toweri TaxID=208326 RepID=A0ABU7BD79_9TELE|nr:hypothetical protein [Ataeniobius toweri]
MEQSVQLCTFTPQCVCLNCSSAGNPSSCLRDYSGFTPSFPRITENYLELGRNGDQKWKNRVKDRGLADSNDVGRALFKMNNPFRHLKPVLSPARDGQRSGTADGSEHG